MAVYLEIYQGNQNHPIVRLNPANDLHPGVETGSNGTCRKKGESNAGSQGSPPASRHNGPCVLPREKDTTAAAHLAWEDCCWSEVLRVVDGSLPSPIDACHGKQS